MKLSNHAGRWRVVMLLVILAGCSRRGRDDQFGTTSLTLDLLDLDRAARIDRPGTRMISSYDRSGGNEDYSFFIEERPEGWGLIADIAGPGIINRMWMTGMPADCRIRIYFDDDRRPAVDQAVEEFFTNRPTSIFPLSAHEQQCWYSYVPISFSQRLRICLQLDKEPGKQAKYYYQINWTPGTAQPQERNRTESDRGRIQALRDVAAAWEAGSFANGFPQCRAYSSKTNALPGTETTLLKLDKAGVIRQIVFTPGLASVPAGATKTRILTDLVLRAYWDDEPEPSVNVPFGLFFGSFGHCRNFNSMFMATQTNRFISRFPMPFAGNARIAILNQGDRAVTFETQAGVSDPVQVGNKYGYFHAAWNRSATGKTLAPHQVLDTGGRGQFVGCFLNVQSQDNSWWLLESDETMWTDSLSEPVWQGTGLEDYFNSGWYYLTPFARPLHGLLMKRPFGTLQYRFHLTDPVTFNSRFRMIFERGPGNRSRGNMESVAYYYLERPRKTAPLPPAEDRLPWPDALERQTYMLSLLDLERLNDFAGAGDYLALIMDRYRDIMPAVERDILRLRQIAYEEHMHGFPSVSQVYREFVDSNPHAAALNQARILLWFHRNPANCLLGAYCNADSIVFLDGKEIMRVDNPAALAVHGLELDPGRHVLAVRAAWSRPFPWVLVNLRGHGFRITTAENWKWTETRPETNWTKPGFDDKDWAPAEPVAPAPTGPYTAVQPNAFPTMQSSSWFLREKLWQKKAPVLWFRREFVVEPTALSP